MLGTRGDRTLQECARERGAMVEVPLLARLRRQDVVDRMARELRVPASIIAAAEPSDQVVAEYLRETLVRLASRPGHERMEPVHVTALLNQVRRQLRPLWPTIDKARRTSSSHPSALERSGEAPAPDPLEENGDSDSVRFVLDALGELSDAAHVGGGFWLPAPTRLVALSLGEDAHAAGTDAMIVSGLSTRSLRRLWHPAVELRWMSRVLPAAVIRRSLREDGTRWQRLEDWLGVPPQPLDVWTTEVLQQAVRRLAPSSPDLVEFDIYCPQLAPGDPQYFRWFANRSLPQVPSGIVLCRSSAGSSTQGRRYWLGTLAPAGSTGPRADREADINTGDIRRLKYGLDLLARAPTRADVVYHDATVEITLRSYLPAEERRPLLAFGEEVSRRPGRLPLCYTLSRDTAELVLDVIGRLGIVTK